MQFQDHPDIVRAAGHRPALRDRVRDGLPKAKSRERRSAGEGCKLPLTGIFTLLPTNRRNWSRWESYVRPHPGPLPQERGIFRRLTTISPCQGGRRRVRGPGLQRNAPKFIGLINQRQSGSVCARGRARSGASVEGAFPKATFGKFFPGSLEEMPESKDFSTCCGSQTRAPGQGQGRIAQRKKPGTPVGRRGLQTSIDRDFHVAANEPQKLVPVGESRPPSPRPSPPGEGASSSVSRQGLRVGNANDLRIANARQRSVRWHFSYRG